jgi:AraC family transcriptional regulator, transcriptional activator of pobA
MDERRILWYFSTMTRQAGAPVKTPTKSAAKSQKKSSGGKPRLVDFNRSKYGSELLIDAAFIHQMPTFIKDDSPHVLTFHDLVLVTSGSGSIVLDGESHPVAPGVMVFTLPGQMREWQLASPLDGACLFFTEEFVADTFSDPRFLDKLLFFGAARRSGTLRLDPSQRRAFLRGFDEMRGELKSFRKDATPSLRASLYQLLVLLNRWYVAQHGEPDDASPNPFVERFRRLVERDFRRRHRVSDYADQLGLTPGHLSTLCRAHTQRSAGATIRARIVAEARKLLLYSDLSAAAVGDKLGFEDPAYFARFFRRETGVVPTQFRGP